MAYKNIDDLRKYQREYMAKFRAANRDECNRKQREYQKERRKRTGNKDYLKMKSDPVQWTKFKERALEWQKKNKEKCNRRDAKGTIDLSGTRYIKRYLHNMGYPKKGVTTEIIEATKQLLIIKRKIKKL